MDSSFIHYILKKPVKQGFQAWKLQDLILILAFYQKTSYTNM